MPSDGSVPPVCLFQREIVVNEIKSEIYNIIIVQRHKNSSI